MKSLGLIVVPERINITLLTHHLLIQILKILKYYTGDFLFPQNIPFHIAYLSILKIYYTHYNPEKGDFRMLSILLNE